MLPDILYFEGYRYIKEIQLPPPPTNLFRFAWDDELPDYNYKCRCQAPDWEGVPAPPAVLRYFPVMKEDAGDFRVNISEWKNFFLWLNGNDIQDFEYWTSPTKAQFNQTGWPMFAYLGMSGNLVNVLERINGWCKIETLKVTDLQRAQGMTRATHPQYIHTFTCVGWANNQTKHIMSTNTNRGIVDYPFITKEGYAYIPERFIKPL